MSRDRPSHAQAFEVYLNLGKSRSLEKLCATLAGSYADPPCTRTLKAWSVEGAWQARLGETADLARLLATTDASPANCSMAKQMHRVAFALMNKALKMALAAPEDGEVASARTVADIGIKIAKHALDSERGKPPSVERLQELMASIGKAEPAETNVTPMPGAARPAKPRDDILRQFDAIMKGAADPKH